MRILIILLFSFCLQEALSAKVLHTGKGQQYADITSAAKTAAPGDTVLVHAGAYSGDQTLNKLRGIASKWIYIIAENRSLVTFDGGTVAWKGADVAYLHIEGFVFAGQTANGLNIDDGDSYATPSHHIVFKNCIFRNMGAKGNNDLLKLSGVDHVTIEQCTFLNGSPGGSGIDMVGCHNSLINNCHFENMGANAVQMKGGSRDIRIEACVFKNAGSRAINLGGNTGLAFFRPADARWEAADLKVYSNVFIGSEAPVAFVNCTRCAVINNTIFKPGRWALRILQENKDSARFIKCSNNIFQNNIICIDERIRTACNVGQGTAPETFVFSNNLWFHISNSGWQGPQLPVAEKNGLIGRDPLFRNAGREDFTITDNSPAAGAGISLQQPERDHTGKSFLPGRAIGALEVRRF